VGVGVRRAARRASWVATLVVVSVIVAMLPWVAPPAQAADLFVCDVCDYTTISAALAETAAFDTIFVEPGTYTEYLDVTVPVSIVGTEFGVIIQNPGDLERPIIQTQDAFLALENVTITGGDNDAGDGGAIYANSGLSLITVTITDSFALRGGGVFFAGGGLFVENTVFVENSAREGGAMYIESAEGGIQTSWFSGNGAFSNPGRGGAIYQENGALSISRSSFTGNGALYGGALHMENGSTNVGDSTFDGNGVELTGGAFWVADGTLEIQRSTITDNAASSGGAFFIATDSPLVFVGGSALDGNDNSGFGTACAGSTDGPLSNYLLSVGFNFLESEDVCPIVPLGNDITDGGDPLLDPLDLVNFYPPARFPQPGSPLIDAGQTEFFEAVDQVGTPRLQNGADDIGAIEIPNGAGGNTPPVAQDDFVEAAADTLVRVDVLENDFDEDGDPLVISNFDEGSLECQLDDPEGTCLVEVGAGEGFGGFYLVSDGFDTPDEGEVIASGRTLFEGSASPTIDGFLFEGEWFEADEFDVAVASGTGWIGLANDAENLYVRIATYGFAAENADIYLFLDGGSDIIRFSDANGFEDLHFEAGFYVPDAQQDGSAASVIDGDVRVIEIAHPLDSGDADDISIAPGDVTQFALSIGFENAQDGVTTTQIPRGDLFELLDWQMTSTGPAVTNVSVAPSAPTIAAGFALPLSNVPTERLIEGAERVAGVTPDEVQIQGAPLGSIPLGAIPLGSIATNSVGTAVLSDITIEGGWARLLVGTPLEGRPLQAVTLSEALEVIPPDVLATIPLEDLDLGSTSVGDLSLASLVLGEATLAQLGLECPAGVAGCDASTSTVLDVESRGGSITAVPLGSIPLGSIPLGSIPLGSIPLGSIPLGSIPLGAIGDIEAAPLGAIPLGSIGDLAAAPLGSIPLGSIPLGAIPLGSIPLGSIPLGSIPLGSIPLGAIDVGGDFCTFHDGQVGSEESCAALGIDPLTTTVANYAALLRASDLAATPLGSIPLGSIPLGSIPLGSIDVSGVPLGAIEVGAVDLAASPLGSIPLGSIPLGAISLAEVCAATDTAPCGEDTSLDEWADGLPAGTGLDATPLGSIPLGSIPLGSIPLGSIDLDTVSVAGTPLGSIPLGSIDLTASPLGSIPLGSIANVTSIVDCAGPVNCATGTLADAYAIGAILDGVTLGQLVAAAGGAIVDATLADVLDHLGLAFLATIDPLQGLTLGELITATLLATGLPWEEFPIDEIEVRDIACGFVAGACASGLDLLEVSTGFTVENFTDVTVVSEIPEDFFYVPGSARIRFESEGGFIVNPIPDPVIEGGTLTFPLGGLDAFDHFVEFSVLPGYALGPVDFESRVNDVAAFSEDVEVVEGFEPDSVATSPDTLYVAFVGEAGDVDSYVIPAPGPGNRVSVFLSNLDGDVDTFMYRPDTAPVSGPGSERSIPLGGVPVEDEGVDFTGGGTLQPEVLADTAPAEGETVAASSTNRGDANEELSVLQRDDISEYRVDVSGYNGASSSRPYVLRVTFEGEAPVDQCTPRSYPALSAGGVPTIPAGTQTIFLSNPGRMAAIHGDASAVEAALADVATFAAGDVNVGGVVVDIADIPGVAGAFGSWDQNPCDPGRANDVVGAITAWIQDVAAATPSLRHITVVGSDEMVPFHRAADTTVIANEATYTDGFEDNALFGAHSTRHYLSDSPYGDLDPVPWLDRFAYLPELAVGRLVETPDQIVGALQAFIANQGVLDPQTAATAGYDFLTDGSEEIDTALAGFLGEANTDTLINETWTRADLVDQFAAGGDLLSPNAHYDHYRALPAIGNLTGSETDLFTIDDVDGLDLANRIIFTMGCHGGLNVDGTAGVVAQSEDWAEVYGGLRAIYIGNTGYGYGDTATVALSEQVMANLAARLDGRYTVGQALADAKQEQFGKAGLYGIYDLKAIEEATLYGLPFWQISGPGAVEIPDTETGPVAVDPLTGLNAAPFTVNPTFQSVSTPDGTFFESNEGTQFLHWRPIQPLTGLEVGRPNQVAIGTVLTGLNSRDLPAGDAVFARPSASDLAGRQPEVETDGVIFPTTFANVATFGQVNPTNEGPPTIQRQRVNLIAGQYIDNGDVPVQRLFDQMAGVVYYVDVDEVDITDFTAPSIDLVEGDAAGSQAVFRVQASDEQSGVSRVVVLYLSSVENGVGTWTASDLIFDADSGSWIGGGPIGAGVEPPLPYIVQAVNGDGVVGVSTSKQGAHQAAVTAPVFPPDAVDDSAETDADIPIDIPVLDNDGDPDGDLDPFTLSVVSPAANGTAEVVGIQVRYTPDPGFAGVDSFTYQVCDAIGLCDTAIVTVTVVGTNSPPDAVDDQAVAQSGIPVDIAVLGNDTDPDGDLDPTSLAVVDPAANGTVTVMGAGIRYTADPDFVGDDSFTYQVCDFTDLCDQATVTVAVTAVPVAPDAVDDAASTTTDTPVTIDVLGNDSDANGDLDPASLAVTDQPVFGSAVVVPGGVEYTPGAGFSGYDTFGYQVCDLAGACASATVDITVTAIDVAPDTRNDLMYVVDGKPTAVFVLDNDTDITGDIDPTTLELVSQPAAGSAEVVTQAEGPVVVFTPAPGQQGSVAFTYQVCDLAGNCAQAVVTILVGIEWCTIVGTAGDNVLNGTPGRDVICGLGGNDTLRGFSGDDVLIGGDGNDTILGGGGADLIFGGEGDDFLDGQDGNDVIWGGNGNDRIIGGTQPDTLFGNAGNDIINGGIGNDLIFLGTGTDQGYGDDGLDTIWGNQGGSKVIGGGQSGDLLIGGAGTDIIAGGEGADRIFAGGGADIVFGATANDVIDAGAGNDLVYGGDGQDTLIGGDGDDTLLGEKGDDVLFGGSGNDTLNGGAGFDTAYGGGGADTCITVESASGC
jgi:Ca2+-binding RTX toxin-like protein